MRVLILPKYGRRAASTRHRFLQYLPALEMAGIHCDVAPLFNDAYLDRKFTTGSTAVSSVLAGYLRRLVRLAGARRYDLLIVYFELLPYLPRWFERLFQRAGIPYVLDLDDAVFLQYEGDARRAVSWLIGDKMSGVFRDATLVMAGNEFLAARARQNARWVEVVPTVVDTGRYSPRQSARTDSGFTIGWMGSPSTAAYLQEVAAPLADLLADAGTRVTTVGAGHVSLPGVRLDGREWSEGTEVEEIRNFDVGIMPLPDTPWARGKCGFKLIEYMACGIPVVASPVGVNVEIVEHGVNGFLAGDPGEWTGLIARLRGDAGLRQRMGEAGRAKVVRDYSLEAVAPRVASLLGRAARRGSSAHSPD